MLKHKFFDMISPLNPLIVFLDEVKLDPGLLLAIIISKLQVSQHELSILVVFHLELIPLFIETFQKFGLPMTHLLMHIIEIIDLLVRLSLVGCCQGGNGGRIGCIIVFGYNLLTPLLEERPVI